MEPSTVGPATQTRILQVRDGATRDAPVLGKLCGNNIPASIFSSGNNLWFRFSASANSFSRGYDITYTSTTEGRGCGGEMFNTRGTLTSPGFPSSFAQTSDCTWKLKVPTGQRIEIRFTGGDFLKNGPFTASFCLFSSFSHYNFNNTN